MNNRFNSLNYKLKIVDNFLDDDDYHELCNLNIEKNIEENFSVYHNEINDRGIIKSVINNDLLKKIHRNCHPKAIQILKEICPEKLKLYEYSDFTIIVTSKNSKFPIHDDTPNKLLSGVVYLSPENNSGTIFYNNKKGEGKNIVDWKTNRAVFFSRREKETWHSYEGDKKNNRIALVYNLMTNKIKDVYKIENKNYLLGNFRFKINPYLYKYFRISI